MRTLVLNSQYLPLSVYPLYTIDAKDALVRYLNCNDKENKTEVILFYDRKVLTPSRNDLYWPSVIVNRTHKNILKNEVRLRKSNLLLREDFECFWCGEELDHSSMTYDHLLPRSKGGKHNFENVVASCSKCNNLKGDNLPIGKWKPKYQPKKMTYYDLMNKATKHPITIPDERWKSFLPGFSNVIIENKEK